MDVLTEPVAKIKRRPSDSEGHDVPLLYATPWYVKDAGDCYFYHTIDLPTLGTQDGGWDLRGRFMDYIGNVDLRGKRVLDVGAATGFLSFEAERHGAREVVSFDLDTAKRQTLLPFTESLYVKDHETWCQVQTESFKTWKNAYWLSHRLLGSQAKVVYGDVYQPPKSMGRFDVIILGAILEHLIDPLSALTAISGFTDDFLIINTDYVDDPRPIATFNGRADSPDRSFVFWTYSIAIYDHFLKMMGFVPVRAMKSKFAGTRDSVDSKERPMLERAALVYRRAAAN